MSSNPSRKVQTRSSFLQLVFEKSQAVALHLGFDANFLPIVASLVAVLALTSLLITLLVWLRYLLATGLITFCIVGGVRRKRRERRGLGPRDVFRAIWQGEHNLEIEDVD